MRTDQQVRGAFFTPTDVAASLVARAGIEKGWHVLEPSAGHGSIVREILTREPGRVLCYEIDSDSCETMYREFKDKIEIQRNDFLHTAAPEDTRIRRGVEPDYTRDRGQVDAVVMNPPFSDGVELAHVRHAGRFLRPGGVLVAIMSPGITFRTTKAFREFNTYLERDFEGTTIDRLPEFTFRDAGTDVATIVLKTYRKW